jgi:hypothetical protein
MTALSTGDDLDGTSARNEIVPRGFILRRIFLCHDLLSQASGGRDPEIAVAHEELGDLLPMTRRHPRKHGESRFR